MSTVDIMDTSVSQLLGSTSDEEQESQSIIDARTKTEKTIEKIRIHHEANEPIYINSQLYGPAQKVRAKILSVNYLFDIITYAIINEFNVQLPSEQENLSSFATSVCSPLPSPPSASQAQSQLESYFSFPDTSMKQSTPTHISQSSNEELNENASFASQESYRCHSQPRIPTPPTIFKEATLPYTDEGKVDILFIEQLRNQEAPLLSLTQFCIYRGFTVEMIETSSEFDYPLKYKRGIIKQPLAIIEAIQSWQNTFKSHYQSFDYWFHHTKPSGSLAMSIRHNMAIREAIQNVLLSTDIPNEPDTETSVILKYKKLWSTTFSVTHNLSFDTWLRETEKPPKPQGLFDSKTLVEDFFVYQPAQALQTKTSIIDLVKSPAHQTGLRDLQTALDTKLLWHDNHTKHYVPPYPVIPIGLQEDLHIISISEDPHARFLAWKMLRTAYVEKVKEEPRDNCPSSKKVLPLIHVYKRSANRMSLNPNEIPLPFHIAAQHVAAHQYMKIIKSPGRLSSFEFYDLFIRPIEVLFSIGMPLHSTLTAAATDYTSRLDLFKEIIRISGFHYTNSFQATPHDVFKELSKIRNLHPGDLLPTTKDSDTPSPITRSPPLPTFPDKNLHPLPEISPSDFEKDGILANYKPHYLYPLPPEIITALIPVLSFPINIFSAFQLHSKVLSAYSDFTNSTPLHARPFTNRYPHEKWLYSHLPKPNSVSLTELFWTPNTGLPPPKWTDTFLSALELLRSIYHSSYPDNMKFIFIKDTLTGTIPLHLKHWTGRLHVKRLTNVVYLNLLFAPNYKILSTEEQIYKFTPRTYWLFTLQLRMLLTKRLPPRTQDFLHQLTPSLYEKFNCYDDVTFQTKCWLSDDNERLVSVCTSRRNKSVFINPKQFIFPWIHLGDVHKLLIRIAKTLAPEIQQNLSSDSD